MRPFNYDRNPGDPIRFYVELLGGKAPEDRREVEDLLIALLNGAGVEYELDREVKRGLAYYVEDGFEATCSKLGAQKQIAGGGRYAEGIGWAIGLDRLLLALDRVGESDGGDGS